MKNIKILVLALTSLIFSEYLQQGTHPECSYVIVTEDGWRIHKNNKGKVLSMKAPSVHNDKVGKYSFDEYGNLIEFSECMPEKEIINKIDKDVVLNTDSKNKLMIGFDFDSEKAISKLKKLFPKHTLAVYGGATIPFGGNLEHYPIGYNYGLDINFNQLSISILGFNVANDRDINTTKSLTANGFLINYTLNWNKFYITPGLGMVSSEGESTNGVNNSDVDNIFRTDIGLHLNKDKNVSIYLGGIRSFTFLGDDDGASYYNIGLKYNF